MRTYQEIFAEAREKLGAVKTLLDGDSPDMERVGVLQGEAKALTDRGTAMKNNDEAIKALGTPVMPAPLPVGDGSDTMPGLTPEGDTPSAIKDQAVKAVYQIRYGEPDEAVKAVLTDLHGAEYNAKRWEQWNAFGRYLKGGKDALKSGDIALLKEVILTPKFSAEAIKSGQDIMAIKTVMVEAINTLGGYTVPVDWQASVIQRLAGLVIMRGRAQTIVTSRDSIEIPTVTGGDSQYSSAVRVTWVDETPTAGAAATNLTFGQEKIPVHTVMAETFLSQNLVEDSAVNLPELLARMFAEAAAIDEDNRFLTGDGNGKPRGLLPSSANALSLSEANSGNASTLTWDGLIELIYTPDSQYRARCIFIGEKASYKAIAKLKDGMGQYLWRDRFGNNVTEGGEIVRLMGYSTFEQEAMPTIASDAYVLLFGDPSGYTIADRIGMTIRRHIDSATDRINQVVYVMRRRLGGQPTETWRWAVQKVSA